MELTDVLTPAEALSTSRELAIESVLECEHPHITFVSYALRVSKLPQFNGEQTQLMQVWIEWMRGAKNFRVLHFVNASSHRSLDDYQRQWPLQAVQQFDRRNCGESGIRTRPYLLFN